MLYALNTFLRLVRFVSTSFVGILVGFILGYAWRSGGGTLPAFLNNIL